MDHWVRTTWFRGQVVQAWDNGVVTAGWRLLFKKNSLQPEVPNHERWMCPMTLHQEWRCSKCDQKSSEITIRVLKISGQTSDKRLKDTVLKVKDLFCSAGTSWNYGPSYVAWFVYLGRYIKWMASLNSCQGCVAEGERSVSRLSSLIVSRTWTLLARVVSWGREA